MEANSSQIQFNSVISERQGSLAMSHEPDEDVLCHTRQRTNRVSDTLHKDKGKEAVEP